MRNGIQAFAALDGVAKPTADLASLFEGFSGFEYATTTWRAEARDADVDAVDRHRDGRRQAIFVGRVEGPRDRRHELGLTSGSGAAEIAATAHARWGADAASRLGGEWTLVIWDETDRTLTLLASECARERLFYAAADGRAAVAPSIGRLAKLPWIDQSMDGEGLVAAVSGHQVRRLCDRTLVAGVRQVLPGTCVAIRARGVTVDHAAAIEPAGTRSLSFEQAMQEVETLLLRVVREHMSGRHDVAVLLSGGLDSSLLAALVAESLEPGQRLHLLCSAAPPSLGVEDETDWARLVADRLGVPLTLVTPDASANVYLPTPRWLDAQDGPAPSPRHYLYEALEDAAALKGAGLMLDGMYGELSLSAYRGERARPSWRTALQGAVRPWLGPLVSGQGTAASLYNVRLSASARDRFSDLCGTRRTSNASLPEAATTSLGWDKAYSAPTFGSRPDVRSAHPFRDPRLRRLADGLPIGVGSRNEAPRSLIRELLTGRVPDAVANRRCKIAFSPAHARLLRDHASAAQRAIPAQRSSGVDEWLDLDWLDKALSRAERGLALGETAFQVQGTAIAAEFLRRWSDRSATR